MVSNFFKFILGFFLAIAILVFSGGTIGLYFVNRTSIPPNRPSFANDDPKPKPKPKFKSKPKSSPKTASNPSPTPSPTKSAELPPGATRGIVTWPEGLSLRAQPSQDAEKIGGVGANQKIIILSESDDKAWKKIRSEDSKLSGWVKSGNIKQTEDQPEKKQE